MYFELVVGLIALGWGAFLSLSPYCARRRREIARESALKFKLFVTVAALVNFVALVYLRQAIRLR